MAAGRYTTIAVAPDTKLRLEEAKKRHGCRSMDELVKSALDELDMRTLARDVRRLVRRANEAKRIAARLEAFERAVAPLPRQRRRRRRA